MIDADKDRAYLLEHYGLDFPAKAKYIRRENRIYFVGDFEDGEEITFAWMCESPSANAFGNAFYYSPSKGYKLTNIKDVVSI